MAGQPPRTPHVGANVPMTSDARDQWLSDLCARGLVTDTQAAAVRRRLAERAALRDAGQDLVLQVEGMTCQHCVARVKQTLEGFDTVEEALPSLSSGQVLVRGDHLDATALVQAVEKAGYKVVQ